MKNSGWWLVVSESQVVSPVLDENLPAGPEQIVGTYRLLRREVAEIRTVSDDELVIAMGFFAQRMKIVVEPTGCLAFAAARRDVTGLRGQRVGVIVSGGNVDLTRYAALIGASAKASQEMPSTS